MNQLNGCEAQDFQKKLDTEDDGVENVNDYENQDQEIDLPEPEVPNIYGEK